MTWLVLLLVLVLLVILTLVSYIDRLYSEMGKFLSRGFEANIDTWEERIEPRLGLAREQISLSAAVLSQLAVASLTLVYAVLLFGHGAKPGASLWPTIGQALAGVVLTVVLFNRLLPYALITRTNGVWLRRFTLPLRLLFLLFMPITFAVSFLFSIVSLAGETTAEEEEENAGAAVDALIEAGQEEGILEEEDHALIRSAVEFGNRVVREVMTPRPRVFAVSENLTIEQLLRLLEARAFSRIPVYAGTLDSITGIVFAHDMLRVTDADAQTRTLSAIAREATFTPETKRANEALREMQREKQHMRIVIDEYGGVAGLLTIEDLLEEIVGAITDEHDKEEGEGVRAEGVGVWAVPGELELSELESLIGGEWTAPEDYEATTVAGLVSETAGRIPMAGEVVEDNGIRFEILASTDRRIERLRVSRAGVPAGKEEEF